MIAATVQRTTEGDVLLWSAAVLTFLAVVALAVYARTLFPKRTPKVAGADASALGGEEDAGIKPGLASFSDSRQAHGQSLASAPVPVQREGEAS